MNTRKLFLLLGMTAATVVMQAQSYQIPVLETDEPMQTGPFQPTWESLRTYEVPEWFRDAKFGIWAHWGPQCVEGSGDWMARELYMEGNGKYNYHRDHYGHPSQVGFKDILPLFRAEHWTPDELVRFYKEEVGAQYFFALGNHHDNFDLWDSKYQEWNSMAIGPHRDILGEWAAAARKVGLPFGASFHADHAWIWYEPSRRFDLHGPLRGVKYDGWLTKEDGYKLNADGSVKWWRGLDPQKLYAQDHDFSNDTWNNGAIHNQWGWGNGANLPTQEYITNFYNRTLDAINRYSPELIYFDVTVLPFHNLSDCGLRIAAHEYNHSAGLHGGKTEAVVFGKILDERQRRAITWDVERGAPNEIFPEPWQTCTCLGGWHWNEGISRSNGYKQAPQVVKMLVDVVSKNGNLLLSVPLRADGTFDEYEHRILEGIRVWLDQNGECIYGTCPCAKFGEGPVAEADIKMNAQGFNEGSYAKMDAREIRFTQTAEALYAIALGWPEDGRLVIRSLAKGNALFPKNIRRVELLGYGQLNAEQTSEGLILMLPETRTNEIAPVLRLKK